MKLNTLALKDRRLFERFLALSGHELSVYNFSNIYIWKKLFKIQWQLIEDNLCIFFLDKMGCFLYLAPLGAKINSSVTDEVFSIMDRFNRNKEISRIENIEAKDLAFYQGAGYLCRDKFGEYLCSRESLAGLKGNKFKSQRASFNYFDKHYKFKYLPFASRHKKDCLRLYLEWMASRKNKKSESVYQGMLRDSRAALEVLLGASRGLNVTGRVVEIEGKIRAFTFGFELNKDTFCILYEITDLSIKGLAQFIFRRFCAELEGYKYINIMDDSGLENLRKVKLSYRPLRLIPAFVITRSDG
jgi:hypothetical protein